MRKIKAYVKCLNEQEKKALLLLLKEGGYEAEVLEDEDEQAEEEISITPGQSGDAGMPSDEVLVVLINPACHEDTELGKVVRAAARAACRVVGIWPKGESKGKVPRVLEGLGSEVITWDPKRVRNAVEGAAAQWETTAGAPRAEPPTKRNRCC